MRKHIPNALTMLRFLLVPVFIYMMFIYRGQHGYVFGLIVFALASFTDYVDGFLARKWKVISDFGKIMDPLADKMLVLSALAALSLLPPFRLNIAIFIIILIREAGITWLREILHNRGVVVPADNMGKLKTVMQMFGIIFALVIWAFVPQVSSGMRAGVEIWFWLVVAITLVSGFNYMKLLFVKGA
jgi:CDP-diacylglycerol--glycerol-3-phosphate 3-phosphatidyltransferase